MKRLLLVGVMGVVLSGCATSQMTQTSSSMPEITEVVEINGKSKDQIFDASKMWMAKSFKSANSVIQYEDKVQGTIIGKGNIQFPCDGFISCGAFGNDKVNFTLKVETKDNRARINFSDITRTPLTYVKGGVNANMGKDIPINIVEHQQAITGKLKAVAEQYKVDLNQQQSSTDW